MIQRWNSSIQSSNTPTFNKVGILRDDFALYRCMVTEVLYVDDPKNISKNAKNPEVLYTVAILGGHASGQTLSYCRLASWLGGSTNHSERILTPATKKLNKAKLQDQEGDIVFVQFIQGFDSFPVIIALAKGPKDKSGAKKADGPRFLDIYNGMQTEVNNKGEYKRSITTGETKEGKFTAKKEKLISEDWTIDEKVTKTFKSGLKIEEDGKQDKISVTTKGGLKVVSDGKGDKSEITTSGGAAVKLEGKTKKATLTTGAAKVEIDGTSSKITIKVGSAEISVDGNTGKIQLKSNFVDLGSSPSDFVVLFSQLMSQFATHSHITTAPGAPTSPPLAPLLPSTGSLTVKCQS